MIKIIAIEREFGCDATTIAETLGKRLGWKVLDQSLTEEVARIAQVSQGVVEQREGCMDPPLYRLLKVFRCGSYQRALPVRGQEVLDAERMLELVQKVVEEAASTGNCVIVGRGSAFFLRRANGHAPGIFICVARVQTSLPAGTDQERSQGQRIGRFG